MKSRGRQSAASLTPLPITGQSPRLTPPSCLTKAERALFIDLMDSVGERHFVRSDLPLLISYVQACSLAQSAAGKPAKLAEWERAVKLQAMLARSLRLTVQSRTDPKTVGRRMPPVMHDKPWADGHDEGIVRHDN